MEVSNITESFEVPLQSFKETQVNPHQNEAEEGPSQNEYQSRLRPRRPRRNWSEEAEEVEKVKKNPVLQIKRRLIKTSIEKTTKPTGPLLCQICKEKFGQIRELVVHSRSSHVGATFNCPFEGCHFSSDDIIRLRTHQYQLQHFLYDQENNNQANEGGQRSETHHEADIIGFRCPSCPYEARLSNYLDMNMTVEALFCHQENMHGTTVDQLKYDLLLLH